MKSNQRIHGLIQSGLIYSFINFVTGLGNLAFQSVMQHRLGDQAGKYSDANSAMNGFIPFLSLIPSIALFAVAHYIAHYKACGDEARLQGLLAGCRKFLMQLTIVGSLVAIIVIKPLSVAFNYTQDMMLMTLVCVVLTLWSSMVAALCQGLSWFKRLAFIGFMTMAVKFVFGSVALMYWRSSETAVLASTVALSANLILLVWRKELKIAATPVSPWNREFVHYLIISTACILGNFFFLRGDLLVVQHFFASQVDKDAYSRAELLSTALPIFAAPLLTVLFTSRSTVRHGNMVGEQLKLLGLYVLALLVGGVCLFVLRSYFIRFMAGQEILATEKMIAPLIVTMIFVGLLQAISFWALSSRWHKVSLLYGGLGLAYWLILFLMGQTAGRLLTVMPIATGLAFAVMFVGWYVSMKHRHPAQT